MTTARSHVRICGRAKITGLAFFDFKQGQIGVAPNAIELHPLLGFHSSCSSLPRRTDGAGFASIRSNGRCLLAGDRFAVLWFANRSPLSINQG
jgi:hypothetical protein